MGGKRSNHNLEKFPLSEAIQTFEIILKVFTINELNPELEKLNIIKISKIDLEEYKNLNMHLQEAMNVIKLNINKNNEVRKNDGLEGKMLAFGEQSKSCIEGKPIGLYKNTHILFTNYR